MQEALHTHCSITIVCVSGAHLIDPLSEHGSWYIQCPLWTHAPVATQVSTIDDDHALAPPLHVQERVTRPTLDCECALEEGGARLCGGGGPEPHAPRVYAVCQGV